jgi:hypothetical protein
MANSKIQNNMILSRNKTILAWGTYASSTSSTKTEITLSSPILQGSLLELSFGTDGRYRYMVSAPRTYSASDTEYTDFVLSPSDTNITRIYWRSNNTLAILSHASDASYALRMITMFV